MSEVVCSMRCDWCGGELEFFPQAKSGLRCKQCWRTEGNDNAPYSIKSKTEKAKKESEKQGGEKQK